MNVTIITAIIAALTSSGLCSIVLYLIQRVDKRNAQRDTRDKNQTKLLLGIAHDRIMWLGTSYIRRGYITPDEYENLHDYLWEPYVAEGGNGACARIMKEVEGLPIREEE